jgi:hypothetical protein
MTSTRSKIVSVAPKVTASVNAQTWTSNVSAKIVDRTLADQGPVERQDRDSYSVTALADITDRPLHATSTMTFRYTHPGSAEIFEQRRAHERLE